ncbi:MAG: tRNA pseudouridine synthase A, partial [Chloroflexi bacterium]|nr:tRNA pseudouridine synthase A [Chloroflexota bacterium]
LEYEGTAYRGSQVQQGLPTIQGELARALYQLTGERPRLSFAGRTDAGAHAWGQVASAVLASPLARERLVAGLNHYLPESIAVREACWAARDFDVRRSPARRCYRYTIVNTAQRSPLWRGRAYHVAETLDAGAMDVAIRSQVGRRDVGPFVRMAGLGGRSTLRTIYRARAWRDGNLVQVELEGDAFLPQQVRRTVGTLIQVGKGRLSAEEFGALAEGRGPGRAGPVAPACGLYLMRVEYRDPSQSGC